MKTYRLKLRRLADFGSVGVFKDANEKVCTQPQGGGRVDDDYAVEVSVVVDAQIVYRLGFTVKASMSPTGTRVMFWTAASSIWPCVGS